MKKNAREVEGVFTRFGNETRKGVDFFPGRTVRATAIGFVPVLTEPSSVNVQESNVGANKVPRTQNRQYSRERSYLTAHYISIFLI